jgi:hypothetical protein
MTQERLSVTDPDAGENAVRLAKSGIGGGSTVASTGSRKAFMEGNHPDVPPVLYHGTTGDFSEFNTNGGPGKSFGTGAFFSNNPAIASTYASRHGGHVMPVHVSMKRPMVVEAEGANWNRVGGNARVHLPDVERSSAEDDALLAELMGRDQGPARTRKVKGRSTRIRHLFDERLDDNVVSTDDLARYARKYGCDGLVMKDITDRGPYYYGSGEAPRSPSHVVVAFKPEQIKSAIGSGFDPTHPDITKAEGGSVGDEKRSGPNLTPAVKVNGSVYAAGPTHFEALKKAFWAGAGNGSQDGDNRGYVNHKGQYLNRQKAMDYAVKHDLLQPRYAAYNAPELVAEWLKPDAIGRHERRYGGAVNHNPTEAQKAAGNYKKGHIWVQGLDISIENPKGSKRSGVDPGGKPWSCTLPADYGYIRGTEGADGDHVDVYLGPERSSPLVFVVNQRDHHTGRFDETKVMVGYRSEREAMRDYCAAFSDGKGPQRAGSVETMSMDAFKHWLRMGKTKRPIKAAPVIDRALELTRRSVALRAR